MSARDRKILSTTLLCASMILAAVNGWADDTSHTARIHKVSYAGLKLSDQQGVGELYDRIRRAAQRVCDRGEKLTLSHMTQERKCRAEAIADAVAQIRNARLAAHHLEKAHSNDG